MDMAEILGGLLKKKSQSGGGIGKILEGLLGGDKKAAAAPPAQPRQRDDFGRVARDAYSRYEQSRGAPQAPAHPKSELDNAQAKILVRAMVNAAKSDGKLDDNEQTAILKQLGDVTEAEVQFLREEFARPLDVKEFAWEIPLGLEQQVYGFSLLTLDLDQNKEAQYLKQLAHGLRLQPEVCNSIHEQCNAPRIF